MCLYSSMCIILCVCAIVVNICTHVCVDHISGCVCVRVCVCTCVCAYGVCVCECALCLNVHFGIFRFLYKQYIQALKRPQVCLCKQKRSHMHMHMYMYAHTYKFINCVDIIILVHSLNYFTILLHSLPFVFYNNIYCSLGYSMYYINVFTFLT